jgi:phosphoglycolate phosphatase-like HAD superfamily hydrolase
MTCEAIICDWNGTLFMENDEEAFFRALASDLAKSYSPWHLLKILHLLKIKRKLESLNSQEAVDTSIDRVVEMFRIFNEEVISGVPIPFIEQSVRKYAGKPEVQSKVIWPVVKTVSELHQTGITAGILSAGYEYGIRMILESGGQSDCFDFIEANPLASVDGKAVGFKLDIYKNKAEIMLKVLNEKNLEAKQVVYIGDSLDDTGCFELIGHPVVSLLAPEKLKERFARQYGAFVPKNEADLENYLKNV